MLSGATGQVYGSAHTWRLEKGWETKLDTVGAMELSYMKNLFATRKWYDLIPDQNHTVVAAGYDRAAEYIGRLSTYMGNRVRLLAMLKKITNLASVSGNTYATAARTSDGSLVIAYMPSTRTVTVDMSKLSGSATALWYDPSRGLYKLIEGSPFSNTGKHAFTPPGKNGDGDEDWVLILETKPPPLDTEKK